MNTFALLLAVACDGVPMKTGLAIVRLSKIKSQESQNSY